MVEVMLMSDVKKLGKAGAIVKVAPGYARNMLIPQGLAAPVTEAAKRKLAKLEEAELALAYVTFNEEIAKIPANSGDITAAEMIICDMGISIRNRSAVRTPSHSGTLERNRCRRSPSVCLMMSAKLFFISAKIVKFVWIGRTYLQSIWQTISTMCRNG